MSISELTRGQKATVAEIPDQDLRVQLMRFGITAGAQIRCHSKIPFGPVVLRYGGQEIALGRSVASQIQVNL